MIDDAAALLRTLQAGSARLSALVEAIDELVFAVRRDGGVSFAPTHRAGVEAEIARHLGHLTKPVELAIRSVDPQRCAYDVDGMAFEARVVPVDAGEAIVLVRAAGAARARSASGLPIGAAPRVARLVEVANRTENAVIVTDLAGRIEWVNGAFTRMTGWSIDDVEGRRPGEFLQGPHTSTETREVMRQALRARAPFDVDVLNYARDGRQYWVHIESRLAFDEAGQPMGYVALETDITARRLAARKEGLAQRVAALLLDSDARDVAGQRVVGELVQELDVLAAQMWVVEPGQVNLVYLAGASAAASGAAGGEFLAASRGLPFRAGTTRVVGVGVPGAVWGTRETVVLKDFARPGGDGITSRRLAAATAAGIRTFCAVPVLGPEGVLGVIEMGGTHNYPGHELLPSLLERVAEQVASFLLHDRSRRAFRSIFEHSPDALLLVGADGRVQATNTRAVDLFGEVEGRDVEALFEGARVLARQIVEGAGGSGQGGEALGGGLINRSARGLRGTFSAEISVATTPSTSALAAIFSVRDLTERRRMEAALKQSLDEKDTLLREVHHRVKNNMQIVSSLLTLQADTLGEDAARSALEESVHRVRSMALVHQQIYATDNVASIHLGDYATALVGYLQGSLDPAAKVEISSDKVELTVEQAVPCGLILNELVTNALKHGRAPDGRCEVTITIRATDDGGMTLEVADGGPGIDPTRARTGSLGMTLLRSLARQLRARMSIASEGGARVTLRVPPQEPGA